ncbi:MAG: hypothetical protein KF752_13575 [Pirellulaceae bacterium]|nr:hypothetical protein [Pirellulaceae bacterium]
MKLAQLGSLIVVIVASMISAPAQANVIYTDEASFQAALPAGHFFNNFGGLPTSIGPEGSINQAGGVPLISYQMSAPSGIGVFDDLSDPFAKVIGNWFDSEAVILQFTSGNVQSAGVRVWLTDVNGARLDGDVTVSYSNGVNQAVPTTIGSYGFIGLLANVPLISMTIAPGAGQYVNFSNVFAAVAVPEPSSLGLALLSSTMLLARRRLRNVG